ncbi:hypothetical protein GOODEAATRI_023239 [Goodea atripinnis]|uniref:Uncharacterized protein n=1 Tax=Goodea atripinnis TaxID=208336 RepID=A0ABV0MK81_9TELE
MSSCWLKLVRDSLSTVGPVPTWAERPLREEEVITLKAASCIPAAEKSYVRKTKFPNTTSSAKSKMETLRFPDQTPSSPQLHLEIQSINMVARVKAQMFFITLQS